MQELLFWVTSVASEILRHEREASEPSALAVLFVYGRRGLKEVGRTGELANELCCSSGCSVEITSHPCPCDVKLWGSRQQRACVVEAIVCVPCGKFYDWQGSKLSIQKREGSSGFVRSDLCEPM